MSLVPVTDVLCEFCDGPLIRSTVTGAIACDCKQVAAHAPVETSEPSADGDVQAERNS